MPFEFDNAINAVPLGEGLYDTPVEDRWDINGNANGGYLLALAASAMRAESGRAHPVSISMHYLSPAPAGPAQMRTEVVKAGRRLATVVGTMTRDGKDIVRSIGTFGDIDASAGPQSNMIPFPDLPPFDECGVRPSATISSARPGGCCAPRPSRTRTPCTRDPSRRRARSGR